MSTTRRHECGPNCRPLAFPHCILVSRPGDRPWNASQYGGAAGHRARAKVVFASLRTQAILTRSLASRSCPIELPAR